MTMLEIRQVVLARSLQMFRSPTGTVGYLPSLVSQLKARYDFVKAPSSEDLVPSDPPKGAEFRHGRLPDDPTLIVDKLTVFNDGIVVDAAESTEHADRFFEDLQEWAKAAIPKAIAIGPRYYVSQLEIKMEPPLKHFSPILTPVGEKISAYLQQYGIAAPTFEISAIFLNLDPFGKPAPQPGVFYIDRRLNVPYVENVWFAQAPLRTKDHIALLEEISRL